MAPKIEDLRAPAALRELKQWLVWKFEPNPVKGKKDLKVPYYAKSGTRRGRRPGDRKVKLHQGGAEDVSLLVTFEEAKIAAIRHKAQGVGIAMVPGCPVTALDFDHCVEDGRIDPTVEKLIFGTYAELSPSGTGVRAFVMGSLGNRSDAHPEDGAFGFETYNTSRFVTFTGDLTPDTELTDCSNVVSAPSQLLIETCNQRFGTKDRERLSTGKSDKDRIGLTDAQILEALSFTPSGDHNYWVGIGMAIHHETAGEGQALWDEWSQADDLYQGPEEISAKWDSFGNFGGEEKTFWSVLRQAQANGCQIDVDTASPLDFQDMGADPQFPNGKYNIQSWSEVRAKPRKTAWLIKGFLPKAVLGVMYGASTTGKSFVGLDMACAIANGAEWNGHRVKQGRVLYVVAEGADGFIQRMDAYDHHHGIEHREIDLITGMVPNLKERGQVVDLVKEAKLRDPYALIIMDTFAQMTPGINENSGEDMGVALDHCKLIAAETGAMVLLVHHSGKDAAKGARGWSGLRAAADVELEVTRTDEVRQIKVTKLKDGRDGAEHGFKLVDVILGLDEDNDPITSCVVEFGVVPAASLGKNETLIMSALHDLMDSPGANRVDEDQLLNMARDRDASPTKDTKSNLKKVLAKLAAKNMVVRDGKWVSPIESAGNA